MQGCQKATSWVLIIVGSAWRRQEVAPPVANVYNEDDPSLAMDASLIALDGQSRRERLSSDWEDPEMEEHAPSEQEDCRKSARLGTRGAHAVKQLSACVIDYLSILVFWSTMSQMFFRATLASAV
eukprot:411001-Amphidinium_carterae.1